MDYKLAGEILRFGLGLIVIIGIGALFVAALMGTLSADLLRVR